MLGELGWLFRELAARMRAARQAEAVAKVQLTHKEEDVVAVLGEMRVEVALWQQAQDDDLLVMPITASLPRGTFRAHNPCCQGPI